jgi:hypothetical protein
MRRGTWQQNDTVYLINYLLEEGVNEPMYKRLLWLAKRDVGETYCAELRRYVEFCDGKYRLEPGVTVEV